jgi:hypothetical protein
LHLDEQARELARRIEPKHEGIFEKRLGLGQLFLRRAVSPPFDEPRAG